MVKKLILLLFYTIFFIMALIYFAPKENIYYFAEEKLQKEAIILNNEVVSDNGFTFEIENSIVYIKTLEVAKIQKIKFRFYFLYNSVEIKDLVLSDMAASFLPLHVKSLFLYYTPFNPLHVKGKCKGAFGVADINIDIVNRVIQILIQPSKEMLSQYRVTLQNLKKDKNGGFVYEQSF